MVYHLVVHFKYCSYKMKNVSLWRFFYSFFFFCFRSSSLRPIWSYGECIPFVPFESSFKHFLLEFKSRYFSLCISFFNHSVCYNTHEIYKTKTFHTYTRSRIFCAHKTVTWLNFTFSLAVFIDRIYYFRSIVCASRESKLNFFFPTLEK